MSGRNGGGNATNDSALACAREWRLPTDSHNYQPKLLAFLAALKASGCAHATIDVMHDEWCDLFRGHGFCNCEPAITVRES